MLWECLVCTTRYSVGAPCCPQCGATAYRVVDSDPEILGDTTAVDDGEPTVLADDAGEE
jgi:hypothetical protein